MNTFHNRTRTSASIPARLLRERKLHLLPLYALLRTSDLAREGIENSGSYRFADHVYQSRPSGRYGIGRVLDAFLLRLPAARSMRNRYLHVQREILAALRRHPPGWDCRVLSVPCGIARDLVEVAATLRVEDPTLHSRTRFFGLDLDPRPLEISRHLVGGLQGFEFIQADALDPRAYPTPLDVVASTGLGEFMADDELTSFYAICRGALRSGGVFVTSGMRRDPVADYLARELAEIRTWYRGAAELIPLLRAAGFGAVATRQDELGLQTLVVAAPAPTGSQPLTDGRRHARVPKGAEAMLSEEGGRE